MREAGGVRKAGCKNFLTKIRSKVLLKTGVMEIGRKSVCMGWGRDQAEWLQVSIDEGQWK